MEIEDEIQFAHVSKVFVERLDVSMDDFETQQFIVVRVDARDEEETRITTVNHLGVLVFEKVAHLGASCQHKSSHVLDNFGLVLCRQRGEPFRQPVLS